MMNLIPFRLALLCYQKNPYTCDTFPQKIILAYIAIVQIMALSNIIYTISLASVSSETHNLLSLESFDYFGTSEHYCVVQKK